VTSDEKESGAQPAADLRLVPAAVAAWCGCWCATSGSTSPVGIAALGAVVVGVAAGLRRSIVLSAIALALLTAVGSGWLQQQRLVEPPIGELTGDRAVVSAMLVTTSDPSLRVAGPVRTESLVVRATALAVAGRGHGWRIRVPVVVMFSGTSVADWKAAPVGSRWFVTGRLEPPDPGSGLAAELRVRQGTVVAPPGSGLRLVERVRSGLRAAVAGRGQDVRGLVPGLVLGDTSAVPTDLVDDFKIAGLTHLTAVSGANLTLLLAFLLFGARWAGVRGWWLRGVGLAGVVVFVGLCRTEPSVLRAAAMGLVALAALGLAAGRAGIRNLAVATLFLLLLDPFLSRSYGFALSVLASAGIIWWAARWVSALRRWLPAVAAEAVAVPLAAQLATTPVVAQLSGTVSVVGLLANALAGPFVGPATVLGFAAAGASLISARLAAVIGFAAAWSAQPIVWVGRTAARLPGASTTWPTSVASIALLVAAVVVIGWSMGPALARRWVCLLAAGVMVAALLRPPGQPGWPPAGWVMVACDVGQGDGAVLNLGAGRAVVIDAGPDPPAMRTCLDRLGIGEVSLLVLTHFHADHIDGLSGVLEHRRIARIWVSPLASPTAGAAAVRAAAAARGIPIEVPAVGSAGRLGSASWSVLGPLGSAGTDLGGDGAESEGENNASLVIMVQLAGVRILLTGDVEPPGQAAMVDARDDLHADVLKVPHHGSGRQEPRFLAAVQARFAVVSAGRHNDYGHPAPRTVAALTALGATVLRTDTAGSIAIVERLDHSLVAVAERDPALTAGRP
jgi:competence protein ComEC